MNAKEYLGKAMWERVLHNISAFAIVFPIYLSILFLSFPSAINSNEIPANQVKAALLEKFARFVHWPDEKKDGTSPFIITFIGKGELLNDIRALYVHNQIKIKDRKVVINAVDSPANVGHCHIVVVGQAASHKVKSIIETLKGKTVLIICDCKGAAENGAHLNFYLTNSDKINFDINSKAIKDANLKADPVLYEVAGKVYN